MKISMSLIIILTTIFCVLPYIWFVFIAKTKSNKIKNLINNALQREDVQFNTTEKWNNNFIGIEEAKNLLLFLKMNSQEIPFVRIGLDELKSCQIKIKSREYIKEKKRETELQSLDLELTYYTEKEPVILNFYDMNDEFTEDFEMKRIEKWQGLIQHQINSYAIKKSA